MVGFSLTFAFFGYFAHHLVQYSGIDLNIIRESAYLLILLFAIVMLSSYLSEQLIIWKTRSGILIKHRR
jgi:hypothetical protein